MPDKHQLMYMAVKIASNILRVSPIVLQVEIFGSLARDESRPQDIDLIFVVDPLTANTWNDRIRAAPAPKPRTTPRSRIHAQAGT